MALNGRLGIAFALVCFFTLRPALAKSFSEDPGDSVPSSPVKISVQYSVVEVYYKEKLFDRWLYLEPVDGKPRWDPGSFPCSADKSSRASSRPCRLTLGTGSIDGLTNSKVGDQLKLKAKIGGISVPGSFGRDLNLSSDLLATGDVSLRLAKRCPSTVEVSFHQVSVAANNGVITTHYRNETRTQGMLVTPSCFQEQDYSEVTRPTEVESFFRTPKVQPGIDCRKAWQEFRTVRGKELEKIAQSRIQSGNKLTMNPASLQISDLLAQTLVAMKIRKVELPRRCVTFFPRTNSRVQPACQRLAVDIRVEYADQSTELSNQRIPVQHRFARIDHIEISDTQLQIIPAMQGKDNQALSSAVFQELLQYVITNAVPTDERAKAVPNCVPAPWDHFPE